jgi:Fe-S-cluster-containing dehydrogenase component
MSKKWGMIIDLAKCTGCQACTVACKEENNVPHGSPKEQELRREPYWHKVITATEGEYPNVRVTTIPMPCMHCEHPECVKVCPVKATVKRPDGIVTQNFRRCIGCRYCIVACPYGVRSFNFKDQEDKEYHHQDPPVKPDGIHLEQSLHGVWPFPHRTRGVVEKCTFCFHRIDKAIAEGNEDKIGTEVVPACVEACPAQARTFGDLDDPKSEVSRLLASTEPFRLGLSAGTEPQVYYLPK